METRESVIEGVTVEIIPCAVGELQGESLTGSPIHVIADDIGAQISIPEELCVQEVLIPEVIAAETIVTTTSLPRRSNGHDKNRESANLEALEDGIQYDMRGGTVGSSSLEVLTDGDDIDSLHVPSDGASVWPPFELVKFKTDIAEDFGSGDSFVALIPDTIPGEHVIGNHGSTGPIRLPRDNDQVPEAAIREMTKRENDRLKKKQLRTNPVYRQKEKEKAKVRMKLRRQDPVYRDVERQRDKQRRKAARQRNHLSRAKERERDKEHKRSQRVSSKSVVLSMTGLDDTYVVLDSLLMDKNETLDRT